MIDYEQLYQAYESDGFYSLQLEIGDICHQGCVYCYMNAMPKEKNRLTDDTIRDILYDAKKLGVNAIEWLGGEPLLRDSVFSHLQYASELGFRNNMWTGGLPLSEPEILEKTAYNCRNGLISIHVSTINEKLYEIMHPGRSMMDLAKILSAVRKLLQSGYPASQILNSVTYTGMQSAKDMIQTMKYFKQNFGIITSLNVYHTYLRPEDQNELLEVYIPKEKETQKIYNFYKKLYGVNNMPLNCVNKQYCSATAAVLSDGSVTPCATIREKDAPNVNTDGRLEEIINNRKDYLTFKVFKNPLNLPDDCSLCALKDQCWGCRSRSFAAGLGLYGKDPRCFRKKKQG